MGRVLLDCRLTGASAVPLQLQLLRIEQSLMPASLWYSERGLLGPVMLCGFCHVHHCTATEGASVDWQLVALGAHSLNCFAMARVPQVCGTNASLVWGHVWHAGLQRVPLVRQWLTPSMWRGGGCR